MNSTRWQGDLPWPANTYTFAVPEDDAVRLAFAVWNPANDPLQLASEKGRTVYAEAFITNPRLGTLADLCARQLAKDLGAASATYLGSDKLRQRLVNEAIDIEQPLENLYEIENVKFWRRLVLAKTKDPELKFKGDDFNWKNEGITLKFIEMVEQCPAEFWPEQKMNTLATQVKDFVTHMHIRQLQSLQDYSFERYLVRDSDTDKETSTDVSYTTDEERYKRFSRNSLLGEEEEEAEEEEEPLAPDFYEQRESRFQTLTRENSSLSHFSRTDEIDLKESARLAEKQRLKTEQRRAERRARRVAQQQRRENREFKRQQRQEAEENKPKPKKKLKINNVFDIPIEEPVDDEAKIVDRRNVEKYLSQLKSYTYPPNHCHHIDLRFLQHFENLVSFAIEFHPPELKEKFHQRHFNFSYEDIQHLASGISNLMNLRVFRLRESRMNATKLETLVASLNRLNVEIIDFGNDQLNDDAEDGLYDLFQSTTTITSLELEGNKLGVNTLRRLGRALKKYDGILKYLGLARNPIDTESLHCLCSKIVNTPQVEELSLAGVRLSEMSVFCCIADELLKRHKVLRHLDLMAVPLSSRSGELLISAMSTNLKVTYFDCRGCNLADDIETDLALCVKRNQFVSKNPYIGDTSKTAEDIEKFRQENKNPVLAAALVAIQSQNTCLESRPEIAERFSVPRNSSEISLSDGVEDKSSKQDESSDQTTLMSGEESLILPKAPFAYEPNKFDKEQFYEHVQLPGPGQRYYYFQAKNRVRCAYID